MTPGHDRTGPRSLPLARNKKTDKHALETLISAVEEIRLARRDLGWGLDEVAMRLTMLSFLRHKKHAKRSTIPPEASTITEGEEWLRARVAEWERFLRWAHASYGWTEDVVVSRAGFAASEVDVVTISQGKARNRALAPNYVLAVDHSNREIVLSVRGTKAFGDAITITHFRPEPFLNGYAHRGFAQSTHALVQEVGPQLDALRERFPGYRVCFTGHSMGGGIAAMASMLVRDRADSRWQHEPRGDTAVPVVERSSSPARSGSLLPAREQDTEGKAAPERDESAKSFSSGGRGAGSKERQSERQRGSGGLPHDDGPMVISFATPSCVSLELARECQPWVQSIVHADDAVPRLSTVSLELLKEDMTAAEWRRAVARLSQLHAVLPLTEAAAAAAAAAVKDTLAGLGNFAGGGRTKSDGTCGRDRNHDDGSGEAGVGVIQGAHDKRNKGAGTSAAAEEGSHGTWDLRAKERNDLGRSIREAVVNLRGVASFYPLSWSLRKEIASIVTQVVNRTDRESGVGAGALEKTSTSDGGVVSETSRESDGDNDNQNYGRALPPQLGTSLRPEQKPAAAAAAAAAAADRLGKVLSRSELMLKLVESVKSLGLSRAALRQSGRGGGSSTSGVQTEATAATRDSREGRSDFERLIPRGTLSNEQGKIGDYSRASAAGPRAAAAEEQRRRRDGRDVTDGCSDRREEEKHRSELQALHESYLARGEPSLLPLYPPGEAFFICNTSTDAVKAGVVGGAALAAGAVASVTTGSARDAGVRGAPSESTRVLKSAREPNADADAVRARPLGRSQRLSGDTFSAAVGSGGACLGTDVPSSDRVEKLRARPWPSSTRPLEDNVPSTEASASTRSRANPEKGCADVSPDTSSPDDDGQAVAASSKRSRGLVVARVPPQHFLRMTLSPTMIVDHTMASYQRALADLRKVDAE